MDPLIEYELNDLVADLMDRVEKKKPGLFLRFNDGEGKVIGCPESYSGTALCGELRVHFGNNVFTNSVFHALQNRMKAAFAEADWVGIPPSNWPLLFARARDVVRGKLFEGREQLPKFAHVSFPQMILEKGIFPKILEKQKFLGIVGCRDLREYFRDEYKIENVSFISVPEQGSASYAGYLPPHFPDFVDLVVQSIVVPYPGAIFLVGAGFCGKIYAHAIMKKGGIAIDVGSLLDLWAGRFTRPYMNMEYIHNYYSKKISIGNMSSDYFHAMADFHKSKNEIDLEEAVIDRALYLWPHMYDFVYRKNDIILRKKNCELAKMFVEKSFKERRNSGAEIAKIAKQFQVHGFSEYSKLFFIVSTNSDPSYAPSIIELANYFMGPSADHPGGLNYNFYELIDYHSNLGKNYQIIAQNARIKGAMGKYEEAIALAVRSTSLFSYDPSVYSNMAAWQAATSQQAAAEDSRRAAQRLDAAHIS